MKTFAFVILALTASLCGPNIELWVRDLNAMGISTFVIDGFTGRGLTVVGPNQALLGRLNLILDAYRGLDILAKHPRVDPSRVVMMGFSRGGQATLFASAPGELVNQATHQRLQCTDACVERDPHTGHDPEATEAARKAVASFLRTTFKL